jgi:hypothetical protein
LSWVGSGYTGFAIWAKRKTSENCLANFQYCLAICNTHCSGHLLKNETEIWKYWVYHVYLYYFLSNLQYFPRLNRRVVVEWNHQTPILVQSSHQHTANHCHE